MPRLSGTLVICVPNLQINNGNELILTLVLGRIHENVVVLSPYKGPFANHFFEAGCSVRIGILSVMLKKIPNVFVLICSTMMTSDVLANYSCGFRTMLILHSFWSENAQLGGQVDVLSIPKDSMKVSVRTLTAAIQRADLVIFQSKAQMRSFAEILPSETAYTVIYSGTRGPVIGLLNDRFKSIRTLYREYSETDFSRKAEDLYVPVPQYNPHRPFGHIAGMDLNQDTTLLTKVFIILNIGEIAPWENQIWIIQRFKMLRDMLRKKIALGKNGVGLKLILARISPESSTAWNVAGSYTSAVQELANADADIEVHEYAGNVDMIFHLADCLLLANTAKIMPLLAIEAMARAVPLILSDDFGVEHLITHGAEGFYFNIAQSSLQHDLKLEESSAEPVLHSQDLLNVLIKMVESQFLCDTLSRNARKLFDQKFSLEIMLDSYRNAFWYLAPPTVLVDMDNIVMDLDGGFMAAWKDCFDHDIQHYHDDAPSPNSMGEVSAKSSLNSLKGSGSDTTFLVGEDDGVDMLEGRTRVDSNETKQGRSSPPVDFTTATKVPFQKQGEALHACDKAYNLETLVGKNAPAKQSATQKRQEEKDGGAADIPFVYRSKSYHLENCVDEKYRAHAVEILSSQHFFLDLRPKEGALEGLQEMVNNGIRVLLCSDGGPSEYTASEKMSWIATHLGQKWLDRFVLVEDKSLIQGEILIETMPRAHTLLNASWRPVVFDMPFNRRASVSIPRIDQWSDWSDVILGVLEKSSIPGSLTWSCQAKAPASALPQSANVYAPDVGIENVSTLTRAHSCTSTNLAKKAAHPCPGPLSTHVGTEKCHEIKSAEAKWNTFAKVVGTVGRDFQAAGKPNDNDSTGAELPIPAKSLESTKHPALVLRAIAADSASPISSDGSDTDMTKSESSAETPAARYDADNETSSARRRAPRHKTAKASVTTGEPLQVCGSLGTAAAAEKNGNGAKGATSTGAVA